MKYAIIVIVLIFLGCTKHPAPPPPDNTINIFFKNSSGNYLFENSNNGYKEDSLRISIVENGTVSRLDSGFMYHFYTRTSTGKRYLYLGYMSLIPLSKAYNTAIIYFRANVVDTLKFTGSVKNGYHDSIWYNGVLQTSNFFDVVK